MLVAPVEGTSAAVAPVEETSVPVDPHQETSVVAHDLVGPGLFRATFQEVG
jgi:hypothetical protein